jgi:hypothetical protein
MAKKPTTAPTTAPTTTTTTTTAPTTAPTTTATTAPTTTATSPFDALTAALTSKPAEVNPSGFSAYELGTTEARCLNDVREAWDRVIDAAHKAFEKTPEGFSAFMASMRSEEQTAGWMSARPESVTEKKWRDTFNLNTRCAGIAFWHGLPWTTGLDKQEPRLAYPGQKASAAKKAVQPGEKAAMPDAEPAPDMAPMTGPQSSADVRAFVEGYAKTLTAYLNKHMALADLPTRDVVQHFAAAVAKLPKP